MIRVFTGASLVEIGHLKNLLEQAGILCLIKNEQLIGAMGEIPFLECQPELWVMRDEQVARAKAVIHEVQAPPPAGAAPWICRDCDASNEAQYGACWQCGASDGS